MSSHTGPTGSANPHDDIAEILIDEAAIKTRVEELGAEIGATRPSSRCDIGKAVASYCQRTP